jgi:hypothetical protein
MGEKLKRESAEAIKGLERYLKRDRPGLEMLKKVSRFVAELRREKSNHKTLEEYANKSREDLSAINEKLRSEITELKVKLDNERNARRQACGEIKRWEDKQKKHISNFKKMVQDNLFPEEVDLAGEYRKVYSLMKSMIKECPKAPPIHEESSVPMIEISSIVKNFHGSEYMLLGKMATLFSIFNMPSGFYSRNTILKSSDGSGILRREGYDSEKIKRWVRWCRNWVDSSGWDAELLDRSGAAMDDRVRKGEC